MKIYVRKMQFRKACVLGAFSLLVLAGCQSTKVESPLPETYKGGVTQTIEADLLRYSKFLRLEMYATHIPTIKDYYIWDSKMKKQFTLSEPMPFELPLVDIVDCGASNTHLNGKKGTLILTEAQSQINVWDISAKGYVSSNEFDVSQCQATLEFMVDDHNKRKGLIAKMIEGPDKVRKYSTSFNNTVLPKIRSIRKEALVKEYNDVVQQANQKSVENWHVNELSDTAKGIATIKVCMEKGTYFLPTDKRAQKVIRDAESYVRNDIRSKVTNKHYYDKAEYQQAYQKGLNMARYLWQHDYVAFSEVCAVSRNAVDQETNK
ncbi:hypothetical protein [Vibrio lentus]|uniref:hypothetical protein n=1 Tax=Vibrio lentus TaxID=136468 RepID=UPI0010553BE5|nr:hypothetical protein [Vibrio lentus]